MLIAALVSALGLGAAGIKAVGSKGKGGGRRRQGRKVISSGLGGMLPTNSGDLRIKPPEMSDVPRSIPRNIASLICWDTVKIDSAISASGNQNVEQNFTFTVTLHPQYSSWLSLFDQYCIVQATVEFDSLTPPGQTYSSPQLYTALDFDNSTALGSVASLEDYSSCETVVMAPEKRHMRSVRPSVKGVVSTTGGSNGAGVIGPSWVDSGVNNVVFFGIRSIAAFTNAGAIRTTQTIVFAFRNQI